jgi:hypothetical protein
MLADSRWVRRLTFLTASILVSFSCAWATAVIRGAEFVGLMDALSSGVGALAGLASLLLTLMTLRLSGQGTTRASAEPRPRAYWLGQLMAVVCVVGSGLAGVVVASRIPGPAVVVPSPVAAASSSARTFSSPRQEEDARNKITMPVDGGEVGRCETIKGQLSPSSRQSNAWLLIQARERGAQDFYIAGQISTKDDGEFEVITEIGGGKGKGVTYALIVVQTNAWQSQNFGERWSVNEENKNTTNLGPSLPDGVEKLTQVVVKRTLDESCRHR